ncbi:MAG: hypothetical protein Q8Q59_06345 [Luteolibacter sp.]|jgi:hypothetical protein|nr:hypothetical protein [Luteolibacter sp.]
MPDPAPLPKLDAALMSELRAAMPTSMSTAELRELGADVLARSVFTARGTNAIFASMLKQVVDQLVAGDISEGQARTALWETLQAIGYTPEGGFPDAPPGEVPPAVKGTLQDLSSFRRLNLIIKTQLALMQGAGQQMRGMRAEYLAEYPAWELIRVGEVEVARDWPSRWAIAGGSPVPDEQKYAYKVLNEPTGMIALKGDPVWGELGSYENFQDALGVDHPPFYFNSEMGWREVSMERALALGLTGPEGETIDEWLASRPDVLAGKFPLPTPRLSMRGVDPAMIDAFQKATYADAVPGKAHAMDYSDVLAREISKRDGERDAEDAADKARQIAERNGGRS